MVSKRIFKGIIIPSGWDTEGGIKSISLQTIDEDEFLIENNKFGNELMDFINAKVEVKGKVRERIDGKKSLSVREFTPVESYHGTEFEIRA